MNTTSVPELVLERLRELDERRLRQTLPDHFCYIGVRKSGDPADPPSPANVVVIKQGDAIPAGTVRSERYWNWLFKWFRDNTVQTGPNVWRWL